MAFNYTLKYRTFDELLAECSNDFKKYQSSGYIDAQELIKVARKCNYELGLRINQTKEIVLDVERGRAKLPEDFYTLNFAMLMFDAKIKQYIPTAPVTEDVIIKGVVPKYQMMPPTEIDLCHDREDTCPCEPVDPCTCEQCGKPIHNGQCEECIRIPNSCRLDCHGNTIQVIQKLRSQTIYYSGFAPLNIVSDSEDFNGMCYGKYWQSPYSGTIKDGWIYTSIDNGKIYINYQGQLEDEYGNILVPDHEVLNEFYEYALKRRIIENLVFNDEEVNQAKIQIIEDRYVKARNNAMSLVNTPNFTELKEMNESNRLAMYRRFYSMFSSYPNFKRN